MASAKKNVKKAKGKKSPSPARKPAPKPAKAAKRPAAPTADKKALARAAKELAAVKAAAKKAAEKAAKLLAAEKAAMKVAAAKAADKLASEKAAQKQAAKDAAARLAAEKAAQKQAAKDAAQKLAAEKAAAKVAEKEAAKAAAAAAKLAAAEAKAALAEASGGKIAKKKPIPTTSFAATPVFRPLNEPAPAHAPPPPPAKPGHVDHQIFSAFSYGVFSAVNKSFGPAGRPVMKNASLRMLEYGYKRGWLPPKAKEPIRALNEFFGRLETMGYAESIHVAKKGEGHHVIEVTGLADFDAIWSMKELHYPLLPIFLGGMAEAILDQYFRLRVTLEPVEIIEQKRGLHIPFSIHEAANIVAAEPGRIVPVNRYDDED